jgi:putative solute:sodium symporter small subunit
MTFGKEHSMWEVNKKNLRIYLGLMSIVGLVFFILGILAPKGATTDDGFPLGFFYFIMGAIFLFTPFIILMFVALMNARERIFIEKGIDAKGKIVSVTETGTYVNNLPKLAFRIQVFRSGFAPYEVEHEKVVSFLSIPRFQVGAIVNIKVNPQNPQKIMITDV